MGRNTITKTTSTANIKVFTKEIDDMMVVDLEVTDNQILSPQELDSAFKNLEEERLKELHKKLRKFFTTKVVPLCNKNLNADDESTLRFVKGTIKCIISDMIKLGENELCGIDGGLVVINLGGDLSDLKPTRIGVLPINHEFCPSYELHLTLIPSNDMKYKMENMLRRLYAMTPLIIVDQRYKLIKKQIY